MSKREFEMSPEELGEIFAACRPVPAMYLSGGQLMGNSIQENANAAWARLGKKLGFKHMTVRPSPKGERFFMAEPTDSPS